MCDSVPDRGRVLFMSNDTSNSEALSYAMSFFESRRSTVRDGVIIGGPVAKLQIQGADEAARKALMVAIAVIVQGAAVLWQILCEDFEVDGTRMLHPIVPTNRSPEVMMEWYTWKIVHMKGYEGVRIMIILIEHPRLRRMLGELEPEPAPPQAETPEEYKKQIYIYIYISINMCFYLSVLVVLSCMHTYIHIIFIYIYIMHTYIWLEVFLRV